MSPKNVSAPEQSNSDTPPLTFVGIAASAGGLEAVSILAQNLPLDANAVYVIAQHMSPTHKSLLSSLISRETKLPVKDLQREVTPEANTIYITPPNSDVVYDQGKLRLREPTGHSASPKPSADRLFKSLAQGRAEVSVGIVLSGTGSDGSYGVQAIREVGGITIAQDPASAKYDGMPASAIETGCIDLTLSPNQIGIHLNRILAKPRNFEMFQDLMEQPNPFSELFAVLLARTQVDFTDYKENTLNRRIARRMAALDILSYDDYVGHCRENVEEVDALYRDLLISVTRFFRDPDQFAKLRQQLEKTIKKRQFGPVRIWVIGCATGEEAYTIAIILADMLGGIGELSKYNVQIFATDIDQNAIDIARRGIYSISAAEDIPPQFLSEYFIVSDTELSVRPELRAAALFSHHNVFQDPPFINMDLVSLRNVLIYFNASLQERVLTRVHYALGAQGLLFLGTSETVGEMSVFFDDRAGADKVFGKRRGMSGALAYNSTVRAFPVQRSSRIEQTSVAPAATVSIVPDASLARAVAPNGAICTQSGSIIEVLGDISQFVEIRAGAPTSLGVNNLREPLRAEANGLIAMATRNGERREGRWHSLSTDHGNRVQLQAFPFKSQGGDEMLCLLAINPKFEKENEIDLSAITDDEQRAYVAQMELEVKTTGEALQQTIEELQTSNEELQAANEELQSTNEEFQATNEELETSNEELQSTNEELLTVNEELQVSSSERLALTSELEAMMMSAPFSIALVDLALMVRRLSDVGRKFFGVEDVANGNVHLSHCNLPNGFPSLAPLANSVLRIQEERVVPVLSEGRYFSVALTPVRDLNRKLIGLSITISEQDHAPVSQILDMIGTVTDVAHWAYNLETKSLYWSPEMFALTGRDASGHTPTWEDMSELVHPEDRAAHNANLNTLHEDGGTIFTKQRIFGPRGHALSITSHIVRLDDSLGTPIQFIGVMWDNSSKSVDETRIAQLEAVQDDLALGFFSFDVQNNLLHWNDRMFALLGYDPVTHIPSIETLLQAVSTKDRPFATEQLQAVFENAMMQSFDVVIDNGRDAPFSCRIKARSGARADGRIAHLFGSMSLID